VSQVGRDSSVNGQAAAKKARAETISLTETSTMENSRKTRPTAKVSIIIPPLVICFRGSGRTTFVAGWAHTCTSTAVGTRGSGLTTEWMERADGTFLAVPFIEVRVIGCDEFCVTV
jgi:hypothetical protein